MERDLFLEKIRFYFTVHPVCGILGPRQVGKTTLSELYAERFFPDTAYFFDLEDPESLARLEHPMTALQSIPQQLIVIDEIQRRPELFPILRVLVDKESKKPIEQRKHYLILGSASRELLQQSSESLAGRIGYIELTPFSLVEVKNSAQLWLRGGFPHSYLAVDSAASFLWRQSYVKTFLENDLQHLGFDVPAPLMRRFWVMLAHYHGQIFNASEIGTSLGISDHTARKYLDILVGTFMVRFLSPWFENMQKRQVKSAKIYFRDSGIFHALINVKDAMALQEHPKLGASWEGFAIEEVIRTLDVASEECFFWATHSVAELDLLIMKWGKRIGFEIKYADAPHITKSMMRAQEDLKLDHLAIIYPGKQAFPLVGTVWAYGIETIATGEFMEKLSENVQKRKSS